MFSDSLNAWRDESSENESIYNITLKLKSLLKYNSQYLKNIYYSPAYTINTEILKLPFKYYNGCLGLKKLQDTKDFINLFNGYRNSIEPYNLLKNKISKIKYPSESNYILEYATFFEIMEKEL